MHIIEITSAIASGHTITKNWEEAAIQQEIANLSDEDIQQIINSLFPSVIPAGVVFYESLASLQHFIGFGATSQSLIARIWRTAYELASPDSQIQLLQLLPGSDNRIFWMTIHCLPGFLGEVEIEPSYLSTWLVEMANRVGQDLAGGSFYVAVQEYARRFPRAALAVFEKYVTDGLADPRLTLSSIILGAVRSVLGTGKISQQRVKKLEQTLKTSPNIKLRICRHRSWAVSYALGAISIESLDLRLNEMLHGIPEEIDEAFGTIFRCLSSKPGDSGFVNFAMNWYIHNASSLISGSAKHYVVSAVTILSLRAKESPECFNVSITNKLITIIQPIPEENQGTWSELEGYLVDRLHEGQESFGTIIEYLVGANSEGLLNQFSQDKFRNLISEISRSSIEEPLTRLLMSSDRFKRRLAMSILQKLGTVKLSPKILDMATEVQLNTILLEFATTLLVEKSIGEFFLALEPYFSRASKNLQDDFCEQMILQAINYPLSFLKNLKGIQHPTEFVQVVISSAERYFEQLKKIGGSPAVSFFFPGFKELDEKAKRAFSQKISESIREQSVLMSLVKHVQIVYGSTWSNLIDGKLSDDNKFSEFHESIEFPRLESIDPEGMKIRRIKAAIALKQLEAQI